MMNRHHAETASASDRVGPKEAISPGRNGSSWPLPATSGAKGGIDESTPALNNRVELLDSFGVYTGLDGK